MIVAMRGTIALIAVGALIAPEALAQDAGEKPKKRKRTKRDRSDDYDPDSAPKVVSSSGKKKKVITLDVINVEGRLAKPAFAIELEVRRPALVAAALDGDVAGALDAVDALERYGRARRTHPGRPPRDGWDDARVATSRAASVILDAFLDEHDAAADGAAAVAVAALRAHRERLRGQPDATTGIAPAIARARKVMDVATGDERIAVAFALMNAASGDDARAAALAVLCPVGRALSSPPVTGDLDGCSADGLDADEAAYAWHTLGREIASGWDGLEVAAAAFARAEATAAAGHAYAAALERAVVLFRLDRDDDALAAFEAARRALDAGADRELLIEYAAVVVVSNSQARPTAADAIAAIEGTFAADPAFVAATIGRVAELFRDQTRFGDAIAAARRALELAPDAAAARTWRGVILTALQRDRYPEAELDAERARFVELYGEEAAAAVLALVPDDGEPIEGSAIRAAAHADHGALVACADGAAVRGSLALTVDDTGAVTGATTHDIEDDAARCVVAIAKRWALPPPDGGVGRATIRLRLEPAQ